MAQIIYVGNVTPFNEQTPPNYQGSMASGATGKKKPQVKTEEKKNAS